MDGAINLSVTPVQALLALALQAWLIAAPIILLRKINRLEALMEQCLSGAQDNAEGQDNV